MSGLPARADAGAGSAPASRAVRRGGAWVAALLVVAPGVGADCDGSDRLPPRAAIASAHPAATEAGFGILEAGGNAFDAAVAVTAALAVVQPYGSGIGGGGFWLLHRADDCRRILLDGRERAPGAVRTELFLDDAGRFVPESTLVGPLSAGIPGTAAALVHLAAGYGRLPLSRSMAPAVGFAREGFVIGDRYRRFAAARRDALLASPAAAAQFLADGRVPPLGHRLRQPALADTLERLANQGHAGFYGGYTAERLVAGVRDAGGIWTLQDLADYRVVERDPIVAMFGAWRLVSAPPPSSGGVLLTQMLGMLEAIDPRPAPGVQRTHALVEVMRRAYRDRGRYLGDPDQVAIPIERLTHPHYAAGLIRDFDPARASSSPVSGAAPRQGRDTTHFSILDRDGNRVAATLSINYPFGSGFVPPGTGVLLNDEMDDFSVQPGVANAYGLSGGEANAVAPGKRMLSSMSPTFLESEDRVAILGTPGGSRIVTMVLQGILGVMEGAPLESWIARPRIHHQYRPDRVELEPGALTEQEQRALRDLGHRLEPLDRPFGDMQAIVWERREGRVEAASDPRGTGAAAVR